MEKISSKKRFYFSAIWTGVLLLAFIGPACEKKPAEKPPEKKAVQAEEKEVAQKAKKSQGLIITCLPRDGQKVASLEQPIFVSFSQPVKSQDFSLTIKPDPGAWATRWEEDGKQAALEHANPFQSGKKYELELSVKEPPAKLIIRFRAYGKDSLQLIDEDAKKGQLDLDTAWTYRLQTLFEPERLPEKYQSPTPVRCGTSVMTEFRRVRNRLKPETREQLKPYLVRPTDPASAFSRRIAKMKKTAGHRSQPSSGLLYAAPLQRPPGGTPAGAWPAPERTAKYSIWAWQDPGMAKAAAGILANWAIWDKFAYLMSVEPPPDDKDSDNGGDGTLDIYLVPPSEHLQDSENPHGCVWGFCVPIGEEKICPSYIIVDATLTETDFNATLAHELFHSFQDAYDSEEAAWWAEGTAEWSPYYIDKNWYEFVEYRNPDAFDPDKHLLKTLTSEEDDHEYAAYLFPFYLAGKHGNEIVGTIWQRCRNQESLDAVNDALPGKFDECFKRFALLNWDQYTDYEGKETYPEEVDVYSHHGYCQLANIPKELPLQKEIELPPLSAKYWCFENNIQDAKERQALPHILFDLKSFKEKEKLTVQAVIFSPHEKRYRYENWTGQEERSFCIDREEENFAKIFLILGNADREKALTPELDVYLNDMGCDDNYAKITRRDYSESHHRSGSDHLTQIREEEATVYISLESFLSQTLGEFGKLIGQPYGSTVYQGQSLRLVAFKAKDFMERVTPRGVEREEKKGDHAEIVMPPIPTIKTDATDKLPIPFKPYPLLPVYFDPQTGKAKYAVVPPIEIRYLWDGKEPGRFLVRNLTQGESSERVKVEGIGSIKKGSEVKFGDGVEIFGGDGEYLWERKSGGRSEYKKQTYTWEIHRKKSDKK